MFKTKSVYYNELSEQQRQQLDEIYLLLTEFNSLMQVCKVAHSSELSHPFITAYSFYSPLLSNIRINFDPITQKDFDYLTRLFIHLAGRYRSGMINKAMQAYNVLIQIQNRLILFCDNFPD